MRNVNLMGINNKLQFAVVREDPLIDIKITEQFKLKKALLVASGGCTAMSMLSAAPSMDIHVFDPNPVQIDHIKKKIETLKVSPTDIQAELFNIESGGVAGLNENGNFESLFRGFRKFIEEHVADRSALTRCFSGNDLELNKILDNKYWPIAFDLFFSNTYLETMFGPLAVQHAPKGSYPSYFKECIERGLREPRRSTNYFLHHIFFGQYFNRPGCLPLYLSKPSNNNMTFINGYLSDVDELHLFDYVMLSNIFDWMDDSDVDAHIEVLKEMKPGALLVYRQLNNDRDVMAKMKPYFEHKEALSNKLLSKDRSLFYSRLVIAVRK